MKNRLNNISEAVFKFIGISILKLTDGLIAIFTKNEAVLNEHDIEFMKLLRASYTVIQQEYLNGQNKNMQSIQDFYKVKTDIKYDDNWKAVPLVLFSCLFKENAERYPETIKIIKQLPGCSAAMFSVLGPGKHIPPHRGIYKGIYRCLFVLQTEENNCWICVNNQKIFFKNGSSVIFDETFEHEVKNDSTTSRVALYLDFYRKLPFPLNIVNNLIYALLRKSTFVKNILSEYQKLENITFIDFKSAAAELP